MKTIDNIFLRYGVFVIITMGCALLTTFLCEKYSVEAQGSGIPEIKTYLSGLRITKYVSPISYVIKFTGLVLMDSGGFFIGKEGPSIQMSTIIVKFLCKFTFFHKINKNSFYRNQLLLVALAGGVCSTFGACYGGLMFSIEICSS